MPWNAKRPCRHEGCARLCERGQLYCPEHMKGRTSWQDDRERGTAAQRGYDAEWRVARRYYLSGHPLCVDCQKEGRITPATVVDHIKPHRGDRRLFWDSNNWQSLCAHHHSLKTLRGE